MTYCRNGLGIATSAVPSALIIHREKVAVESEVKKRKALDIDKSRLEREILELQRRADRERTKREELESRWAEDGTAPRLSPTSSPVSSAAHSFAR